MHSIAFATISSHLNKLLTHALSLLPLHCPPGGVSAASTKSERNLYSRVLHRFAHSSHMDDQRVCTSSLTSLFARHQHLVPSATPSDLTISSNQPIRCLSYVRTVAALCSRHRPRPSSDASAAFWQTSRHPPGPSCAFYRCRTGPRAATTLRFCMVLDDRTTSHNRRPIHIITRCGPC